jgi:hypothetical protein
MPNPKKSKTKTGGKKSAAPKTLSRERLSELSEEFIHFSHLRATVEENLTNVAGLGARRVWSDLLRVLDLAADAAERVEGYDLNADADRAVEKLASFLR